MGFNYCQIIGNNGTLLMPNAQQPTRQTRHMDIKKFALLEWVEQDLMILKTIKTAENAVGKQLFHRHADTYMDGKKSSTLSAVEQHESQVTDVSMIVLPYRLFPTYKHGGGDRRT